MIFLRLPQRYPRAKKDVDLHQLALYNWDIVMNSSLVVIKVAIE